MIPISLGGLILMSMVMGIVLVFALWVIGVTGVRRTERRRYKGVVTCRICSVRYEAESNQASPDDDVTTCPACGTPNELKPPVIM